MAVLKNRAGVTTATTGTGTVTLGPAIPFGTAPFACSWLQFGNAGVAHGDVVRYLILDSNGAWEYGPGTYDAGGGTMTRAAGSMTGSIAGQKSSTGSLLFLTGTAQVFITAVAEDIPSITGLAPLASPVFTGNPTAPTPTAGDNDTSVATTAFVTGAVGGLAPLASPAFTGNPTGPTAAPGDNDTSLATTAFVTAAVATGSSRPVGQCYLKKVGANLVLLPQNGNQLTIGGVAQTVPDGGVTLAPTGNSINVFYYIYAFMNGATMTLEFSTTAYAVQSGTGLKIKSGDSSRTLVGLATGYTGAGAWSSYSTDIVSLFNPVDKTYYPPASSGSTSSTTPTVINSSSVVRFVSFSDREVIFRIAGRVNGTVNTASLFLDITLDSGGAFLFSALNGVAIESRSANVTGDWNAMFGDVRNIVSDTQRHTADGVFYNSTGTISFNGNWSVTVRG